MTATGDIAESGPFSGIVENETGASPVVLVCEHASRRFPARWGQLGLTDEQAVAHIAWDPGALGLSRGLSARLDAALVHAPVSRLIYDCNRAPNQAGAMAVRSEFHAIPGNQSLSAAERNARTEAVDLPFHATLRQVLARRMAEGRESVVVTIHSFTPVWHGQARSLEFGVIHDADAQMAEAILAETRRQTGLRAALNEPYSAADDVTHTLRLQATPYGLRNAMLEIRNDLIADAAAEAAMADILAPVIRAALSAVQAEVAA
jgi:predicted N-formylglutamate amidohydrolase